MQMTWVYMKEYVHIQILLFLLFKLRIGILLGSRSRLQTRCDLRSCFSRLTLDGSFNIACFSMKGSLVKRSLTRFADRPVPKTLEILQCGSTANAVCIFCMHFQRIIHSIYADFAPQMLHFFSHYTMLSVLCIYQAHAFKTSRMRVKNLIAVCS